MRLNVLNAALLVLLFPMSASSAEPKVDAKVETRSDAKADDTNGTWLPESAELNGQSLPDEFRKTLKLELKDDKYKVTVQGRLDEGTTKADATTMPKSLDITGINGPNKGKTLLAIYELNGDTLKVCYDLSGGSRPKEFKTSQGTQQLLITYKREKPKS